MELLQQYFDTAFAAPDGIPKLRELILKACDARENWCARSKMTTGQRTIRTIEAEKKRLVKERKRSKRPKPCRRLPPTR